MHIIVPLAGPDFEQNGTLKGERLVEGRPLLRAALESRPWYRNDSGEHDYIFIFHDTPACRSFFAEKVSGWYSGAQAVFLSAFTRGAALTAAAGLTLLCDQRSGPVCIDLADILYQASVDPEALFEGDPELGAALPVFSSDKDCYSYAVTNAEGYVSETAEKEVISAWASAGTYFFRNGETYLAALAAMLAAAPRYTHNGLHYVCPIMNGVRWNGMKIKAFSATDVMDIKTA